MMPRLGYLWCDGCDCRVKTVPADESLHDWPCVPEFPGEIGPCHYIVIARCRTGVAMNDSSCFTFPGTFTEPLTYKVFELKKECYVGNKWLMRVFCPDFSGEAQDITPDAVQGTFPPWHTGSPGGFHEADYRSSEDFRCLANGNLNVWELVAAGIEPGDVTFTVVHPDIVALAAGTGKTIPVYTNRREWNPFGSNTNEPGFPLGNTMDITAGYDDFPQLPKSICVVAKDDAHAGDNPCTDQESRCACNDFTIGETGTLLVNITGCDSISGLQTVTVQRTCPPETLPCGIEYPASSPCCIFLGSLSTGAGCSNVDGDWSGDVRIMVYCDPAAGEAERYKMKVYCYDTALACYAEQGVSVDLVELTCDGSFYIEFTITDLDCCCPEPPACCNCDSLPNDGTISDGSNSLVLSKTCVDGNISYTVVSALDSLCGEVIISGNVDCADGAWTLTLNGTTIGLDWDGDCDAIVLTGVFGGSCNVTIAI